MKEKILKELHKLFERHGSDLMTKEKLQLLLSNDYRLLLDFLQQADTHIHSIENLETLKQEINTSLDSYEKLGLTIEVTASDAVPEEHRYVKRTYRKRPKKS